MDIYQNFRYLQKCQHFILGREVENCGKLLQVCESFVHAIQGRFQRRKLMHFTYLQFTGISGVLTVRASV